MLRFLDQKVRELEIPSRVVKAERNIQKLINALSSNEIDLIPAGAGWSLVKTGPPDIEVCLDHSKGALLWIDGAVAVRNEAKQRLIMEFLDGLVAEDLQKKICTAGPYGGHPTNLNLFEEFRKQHAVISNSEALFTKKEARFVFNKDLVTFRWPVPAKPELWADWWRSFKKQCACLNRK